MWCNLFVICLITFQVNRLYLRVKETGLVMLHKMFAYFTSDKVLIWRQTLSFFGTLCFLQVTLTHTLIVFQSRWHLHTNWCYTCYLLVLTCHPTAVLKALTWYSGRSWLSWMSSTRISSLPLRSSLSYSRQAQEHNVHILSAHVLTVRRQLRLCTSLPLSPVFPICPAAPMMPGIPRDPSRPCGPCGPGEPGGPGGPGGPMTPAPPSTALWALTATAASLSVRAESISILMGFA